MTDETEITPQLLDEAYRRGFEYLEKMGGCAQTVFSAIMDTLGYQDDLVINEIWKGTIGLSGGTGAMATGTYGAMAGAAIAISYSFGFTLEDFEQDNSKRFNVYTAVVEVGRRMQEKYGSIQCQEVQFQLWGKSYRFTNPQAAQEFSKMWENAQGDFECSKVTGDLAKWGVEIILEHNPQFSRRK